MFSKSVIHELGEAIKRIQSNSSVNSLFDLKFHHLTSAAFHNATAVSSSPTAIFHNPSAN